MMYGNSMMKDMVMLGPFMWSVMLLLWSAFFLGFISAGRWLITHTGHARQKRSHSAGDDSSHNVS